MSNFSLVSIVFALVAAAIYLAIVYFAGRKGWWWLALLVSLPAILAMVMFMQMPSDFGSQSSSVLFRHFEKVGFAQLFAGAIAYFLGKSRSLPDKSH
jgi:hypothetical protein